MVWVFFSARSDEEDLLCPKPLYSKGTVVFLPPGKVVVRWIRDTNSRCGVFFSLSIRLFPPLCRVFQASVVSCPTWCDGVKRRLASLFCSKNQNYLYIKKESHTIQLAMINHSCHRCALFLQPFTSEIFRLIISVFMVTGFYVSDISPPALYSELVFCDVNLMGKPR